MITTMFAQFGEALRACRITLFQNEALRTDRLDTKQRYAWHVPHATPDDGAHTFAKLSAEMTDNLSERLARGDVVVVDGSTSGDKIRRILAAGGATAAILVPIVIDDRWWGEIEIDGCHSEQKWSKPEIDACNIFSALMGAAIVRARTARELADAGRIIENSTTILFRFSAQKPHAISYVSNNIGRYGYTTESVLSSPFRYLELIHPEDLPQALEDIERVATGATSSTNRDVRLRAANGHYLWFEVRMVAVRDKNGSVTEIEGLAIDVDRRKTTESYIVRFRLTDQLTGLPNRAAFLDELRHAFAAAKRGAKPFAILYIDLDHFKDVNDVLSHNKGDTLLKLVALRVQGAVRTGDVVARLGGDEFAVLQIDIADPSDAGALASRILRDLAQPP